MVRSRAEWQAHPQGAEVATLPLLEIVKIGEAPPEPRRRRITRAVRHPRARSDPRDRGTGVRPHPRRVRRGRAGGQLAASAQPPRDSWWTRASASSPPRSTCASPATPSRLRALLRDADVFCQSYRPGALARLGLRPEDAARIRPGIVYVTLSAFSHAGPWRERRGFETIIQSVSGMAQEQGLAVGSGGAAALARPGGGPRHRLSRCVRRAGGAGPPRPRGRQLPRPRVAGPDGTMGRCARAAWTDGEPAISHWTTCRISSRTWIRPSARSVTSCPPRGFPRRPRSGRARRCPWAPTRRLARLSRHGHRARCLTTGDSRGRSPSSPGGERRGRASAMVGPPPSSSPARAPRSSWWTRPSISPSKTVAMIKDDGRRGHRPRSRSHAR